MLLHIFLSRCWPCRPSSKDVLIATPSGKCIMHLNLHKLVCIALVDAKVFHEILLQGLELGLV